MPSSRNVVMFRCSLALAILAQAAASIGQRHHRFLVPEDVGQPGAKDSSAAHPHMCLALSFMLMCLPVTGGFMIIIHLIRHVITNGFTCIERKEDKDQETPMVMKIAAGVSLGAFAATLIYFWYVGFWEEWWEWWNGDESKQPSPCHILAGLFVIGPMVLGAINIVGCLCISCVAICVLIKG